VWTLKKKKWTLKKSDQLSTYSFSCLRAKSAADGNDEDAKKICLFMHNKKSCFYYSQDHLIERWFFTFLAIFSSGTIAAYAPAVTRTLAARDRGEEGIGRINGSSMD
jgi:hypothetical protein